MGFYEDDELIDAMPEAMKNTKVCYTCKHLHSNNRTCEAFPQGVPMVYKTGEKEHTSAKKQGNSIVWEYDEKQKFNRRETARSEKAESKVIECGEDAKKARRVEKDLEQKGYTVRIHTGDTWPIEYTVIGTK